MRDEPTYRIEMVDGSRYEVPEGARVLDYGYSILVVRNCTCHCGDSHEMTIESWPRSAIRRASVSQDGLAHVFVKEKDDAEARLRLHQEGAS
jgi:hypothetical protein